MVHFEHEHRWLVIEPPDLTGHYPTMINQAYMFIKDGYCIRVRRCTRMGVTRATTESWDAIAIKGPRWATTRAEEEWPLASELATSLYRLSQWKIVKSRYQFIYGEFTWELDQFHHANEGLYIAECETENPDVVPTKPPWAYKDITGEPRFDNEQLAMNPFTTW